MSIIFYHCDADGRSAGAIIHKYIRENFPDTEERYVEIQYGQEEQVLSSISVLPGEVIYVVDFHFSPEIMKRLWKITQYIYVFDHHKTTEELLPQYPEGVKCICDPGNTFAGCELVWNYLFPKDHMPRVIELIADQDKGAWKYGEETAQFNEGLKLHLHHPTDRVWGKLLNNPSFDAQDWHRAQQVVKRICNEGKTCLRYRGMLCKDCRDLFGFEAKFQDYKCYVLNLRLPGVGSEMFVEKLKEYDMCISLLYTGDYWKVSLRSDGKVDVSEIAAYFLGGGHKQAAGFQCGTVVVEGGELKCLE